MTTVLKGHGPTKNHVRQNATKIWSSASQFCRGHNIFSSFLCKNICVFLLLVFFQHVVSNLMIAADPSRAKQHNNRIQAEFHHWRIETISQYVDQGTFDAAVSLAYVVQSEWYLVELYRTRAGAHAHAAITHPCATRLKLTQTHRPKYPAMFIAPKGANADTQPTTRIPTLHCTLRNTSMQPKVR